MNERPESIISKINFEAKPELCNFENLIVQSENIVSDSSFNCIIDSDEISSHKANDSKSEQCSTISNQLIIPIKHSNTIGSFLKQESITKSNSFSKISMKRRSSGEFIVLKKYLTQERVRRSFQYPKCRIYFNDSLNDFNLHVWRKYSMSNLPDFIKSTSNLDSKNKQPKDLSSLRSCLKKHNSKSFQMSSTVTFGCVTIYCFERVQGFTSVPTVGGISLGMSDRHWVTKVFEKEEDMHFGRCPKPIYRYPLSLKTRKSILNSAGIKKFDQTETAMCRNIRLSRSMCGCKCANGVCLPSSCECAINGIACQIDIGSYPCSCAYPIFCSNPAGRTEFSPLSVKAHYIHTTNELSQDEDDFIHSDPPPRMFSNSGDCLDCKTCTPKVQNILDELKLEQKQQRHSHRPSLSRRDSADFTCGAVSEASAAVIEVIQSPDNDYKQSSSLSTIAPVVSSTDSSQFVSSPVFTTFSNTSLIEYACNDSVTTEKLLDDKTAVCGYEQRIYEQTYDSYDYHADEQLTPEETNSSHRRYSTPAFFNQHHNLDDLHSPVFGPQTSCGMRSLETPLSKIKDNNQKSRNYSTADFPGVSPLITSEYTKCINPAENEVHIPTKSPPPHYSTVNSSDETDVVMTVDDDTQLLVDEVDNPPTVSPFHCNSGSFDHGKLIEVVSPPHSNDYPQSPFQIMGVAFKCPLQDSSFHLPDEIVKSKMSSETKRENRKSRKNLAPLKMRNKISRPKLKASTSKSSVIQPIHEETLSDMTESHENSSKSHSKYRTNIFDSIKKVFQKSRSKENKVNISPSQMHNIVLNSNTEMTSACPPEDNSDSVNSSNPRRTSIPHGDARTNANILSDLMDDDAIPISEMNHFSVNNPSTSPSRSNIENLPETNTKSIYKNITTKRRAIPKSSRNCRKSCIDLYDANPYYLTRHTLKQYYSNGILIPVLPSAVSDDSYCKVEHSRPIQDDRESFLPTEKDNNSLSSRSISQVDSSDIVPYESNLAGSKLTNDPSAIPSSLSQWSNNDHVTSDVVEIASDYHNHPQSTTTTSISFDVNKTNRNKITNVTKQKIANRKQCKKSTSLSTLKFCSTDDGASNGYLLSTGGVFTNESNNKRTRKSSRFQSQLSASDLNSSEYQDQFLDPYYLTRRQIKQLFSEPAICSKPVTSEISQST